MGTEEDTMAQHIHYDRTIREARALGTEHGHAAGTWVEVPDEDTARWLLAGIDDVDPEAMDSLPSAPLSGEWAGDPTIADVLREVGIDPDDVSDDDWDGFVPEVLDAYEEAWHDAMVAEVTRAARAMLADVDA